MVETTSVWFKPQTLVGMVSLSSDTLLTCSMFRCRHRWERRKTSVPGCRFFSDPIQLSNQTANVARSEFLPTICQACTVRHTSWTDHFNNAGGVFVYILFRANCSVSGVVNGWVCDCVYNGAGVFPRIRSGCQWRFGIIVSGVVQGLDKGDPDSL
jgi:hypothetical protein